MCVKSNILYQDKLIREKLYGLAFLIIYIFLAPLCLFLSIGWFLVYGIADPLFWLLSLSTIFFITMIPFLIYHLFKIRFEIYYNGVIVTKPMSTYYRLLFKEKKDGRFIPFEKITSYRISKFPRGLQIFVNGKECGLLSTDPKKAYSILDKAYKDYVNRKALEE